GARPSSPPWRSRARRGRPGARGRSRRHRRTDRAGRGRRRASPGCWRPRRANGRRRGRSPPCLDRPLPAEAREVELAEGLLDEAALVVLAERLPRHLLRRLDGEVGDLLADLLDRAAGLHLDVTAGLGDELLALLAAFL